MHKSRSFPTFRGLSTIRWYLVFFPRYQLLDVWHRWHKNGSAGGLPRQLIGLRADFTEKVQPLRSDWSTYDPSGAECWSNAPLQGQARLKYTFARLFKPWRDLLILNETFLLVGETERCSSETYCMKTGTKCSKYQTKWPKYYISPTKSRLFSPIFPSILVWRGTMSIGRGKSPSGEENFTLARNDASWRGTMLKVRLSSSTNRVRSFVDGSCGRVGMGR